MVNKFYQEARQSYQNLSEEEKDKKQKKVRDRYKNLPIKRATRVYEKILYST